MDEGADRVTSLPKQWGSVEERMLVSCLANIYRGTSRSVPEKRGICAPIVSSTAGRVPHLFRRRYTRNALRIASRIELQQLF